MRGTHTSFVASRAEDDVDDPTPTGADRAAPGYTLIFDSIKRKK